MVGDQEIDAEVGKPEVDPEFVTKAPAGLVLDVGEIGAVVDLEVEVEPLRSDAPVHIDNPVDLLHLVGSRPKSGSPPDARLTIKTFIHFIYFR